MPDLLDRLKTALADRYAIQEELGAGGMATVYLAEDLKHNRKVAVKVLRPVLAAILGAERFLNEIEVTANLQHPNILPFYDSGEADTFLYDNRGAPKETGNLSTIISAGVTLDVGAGIRRRLTRWKFR